MEGDPYPVSKNYFQGGEEQGYARLSYMLSEFSESLYEQWLQLLGNDVWHNSHFFCPRSEHKLCLEKK